jgi:hypothetical protein
LGHSKKFSGRVNETDKMKVEGMSEEQIVKDVNKSEKYSQLT